MLWVFGIDVMAVSLPTLHFPECRIAAVQQVYTVSSTKLYFASRRYLGIKIYVGAVY